MGRGRGVKKISFHISSRFILFPKFVGLSINYEKFILLTREILVRKCSFATRVRIVGSPPKHFGDWCS